MSTITPHYRSIQQLLQSQSFAIDEYQREYKWEKENIIELLADLRDKFLSCYQPGDLTKKVGSYDNYFLGSIIISKHNGKNYLIDGQQRVTSLTLFLIYLHNEAKLKNLSEAQAIAPLIFSHHLGELQFNLDIPERLPALKALFHQNDFNPEDQDESVQTMFARYGDVESIDLAGELAEALPNFIWWLMTKVGLIEISTDNNNDAYAIFETMNDRGKPLSPVDMLKASLLVPIENPELRRKVNQIWREQVLKLISWGGSHEPERDATFIKAWLRAHYAETIRERKAGAADKDWELIGNAFHRWVRENQERLKLSTETNNLEFISSDFTFFSQAYQRILEASRTYQKGWEAVFYNAHNEFTWQNTVLLAPLCISDDSEIQRRKIAATATYLDIWLMRRAVNYIRTGYSSTSYAMFQLCREIRRKPLNELIDILYQKLANDEVTLDRCLKKKSTGIRDLALNQSNRRYIYHLLARLTAFTEVGSGQPDRFAEYVDRDHPNGCHIEHIWANNYSPYKDLFPSEQEFQDWRNGIAGLLLLPGDVNSSFQDKPFEYKSPFYAQQNLFAASLTASTYQHQPGFKAFREQFKLPFKPYEHFGKAEHRERRELACTLAHLVWSPERLRTGR
jgi:uncharacterized protein with ParB-like and HNH nuclease domain